MVNGQLVPKKYNTTYSTPKTNVLIIYSILTKQKVFVMKNLFILVLFFIILQSCRNDGSEISDDISREIKVMVNGERFETSDKKNGELISGNTDCNTIFISAIVSNNSKKYRINFQLLKNGELIRMQCWEVAMSGVNKLFMTPDFNPRSSFQISDFHYDEVTNYIKFGFAGTLYLEDEPNSQNTKTITGNIDIRSFEKVNCSLPFYQDITYKSNDFNFNTIHGNRSKNEVTLVQNHNFYSNNGYKLTLEAHDDLWSLPTGTYHFNEMSNSDRVQLEKYIGDIVATQTQTINANDWENLKTIGYFTIDAKEIINSNKKISGKITMSVYQENQQIFEIKNMQYTTGSFE
jgi:hypothetical protein